MSKESKFAKTASEETFIAICKPKSKDSLYEIKDKTGKIIPKEFVDSFLQNNESDIKKQITKDIASGIKKDKDFFVNAIGELEYNPEMDDFAYFATEDMIIKAYKKK